MSYSVTIANTGHQFECEPVESILEAALRSGINLSYHCATGSCGECKARVIDGNVAEYRHHDFVIPEAEKIVNTVLLCSVSPRSDLVIEASEAANASDVPLQHISVKVNKLEQPNENNAVLYLRTPRSRTLRFLAGQYVKITGAATDPYYGYVASCPCNGMIVQIHVQRNEHPFADYVFNTLKTGDSLELEGPFGDFTLDESSRRPVVMVAQDIGFAPMKSLIEHAIALDLPQSMMLFWLAEQGQDHYQSNYCRSWEDALDSFLYRPLHLDTLDSGQNDYHSACQYVLGRTPVETEIDLYLSGPRDMLADFSYAFSEKGTPQSRIHMAKPLWDDSDK